MSERHLELARLWFGKARNDLVTARQTLLLETGPTDTVCFHAQQAAEKSLKAFLTATKQEFPKTHDLLRLLDLSLAHKPDLDRLREELADLAAYAVEVRYPGDWFEPTRGEAIAATDLAEQILVVLEDTLK